MTSEEIIFVALFFFLLFVEKIREISGEEYDCEQEGVVYVHREFPDKPNGYKEGKTETWEICQKVCAKYETCTGFTWYNENTCEDEYKRLCSLFSTYRWKATGYWWTKTAVSGLKKCLKNAAGK